MIYNVCKSINNFFSNDNDKHFGTFEISGGTLSPLDFLKDGQYFRIIGSTSNDGIYVYPTSELTDETFDGAIWAMNIDVDFLELVEEIKQYNEKNPTNSLISESFGGYSYTKATDKNGSQLTWKQVFADKLNSWRKL